MKNVLIKADGRSGGKQSVAAQLQRVAQESGTSLLEILSQGKRKGLVYFEKGVLFDAVCGNLKMEDAALALLALNSVDIRPLKLQNKKYEKRIHTSLQDLLAQAEQGKDQPSKAQQKQRAQDDSEAADPGKLAANNNKPKEEEEMALEKHIEGLRDIMGYKAAAIMNFTGEVLAFDSLDPNIDLNIVGATFNDIFRSSHEASGKVGLDACNELTIQTPKGIIIMVCSGVDAKTHVHLIGIMSADGNQALMRMQLQKMSPGVVKELS